MKVSCHSAHPSRGSTNLLTQFPSASRLHQLVAFFFFLSPSGFNQSLAKGTFCGPFVQAHHKCAQEKLALSESLLKAEEEISKLRELALTNDLSRTDGVSPTICKLVRSPALGPAFILSSIVCINIFAGSLSRVIAVGGNANYAEIKEGW